MKTLFPGFRIILILTACCQLSGAGVIWTSPLDGNAKATVGASGVPTGNPEATEDKNGNAGGAVLFDGSSFFDIGPLGSFNAGSLSVWLRADDLTGERGAVAAGASGAGTDVYFSFMSQTGLIRGDLDDGALRRPVFNDVALDPEVWYHIVFTFDSNAGGSQQLRIYQDGVLQASQPSIADDIAPYVMTHSGLIGTERTTERFWIGALDDVRIYDNELTQEQVEALFAGGPQFGTPGDADSDGLPDLYEVACGLNPADNGSGDVRNGPDGDPDGDLLTNLQEYERGTRADLADTDGDGFNDKVETKTGKWVSLEDTGTDPLRPDTDGDGLPDGVENNSGTFVSAAQTGSNPHLPDTDGDTLPDGYEVSNGLNPVSAADATEDPDDDLSSNLEEFARNTNPQNPDTDGDGFRDGVENGGGVWESSVKTGTDPLDPDTDGDGLADGVETNTGNFISATDAGTDPHNTDTDGDDFTDRTEVMNGSNPVLASSTPVLVKTLFVGGNAAADLGADGAIEKFLQDHFGLEAVTYIQASAVTAEDAELFDLVFLSSSPGSGDLRYKFRDVTVPVINCEEAIADNGDGEFGLSSAVLTKSVTTTQLTLAPHPVTAGLPSTITLFTGAPAETLSTTALYPGITLIASAVDGTISSGTGAVGDSVAGFPVIYLANAGDEVDAGAGLPDSKAPAKRVQLPFTDATFATFTGDGRKLMANILDWAVGRIGDTVPEKTAVTGLALNPAGDTLTVTWQSDPAAGTTYSLLSSADLSAPVAGWTVVNPSIPTAGAATSQGISINPSTAPRLFYRIKKN